MPRFVKRRTLRAATLFAMNCCKTLFIRQKMCYNEYIRMLKRERSAAAMFEPKVRNGQTDLLMEAVLKLESTEDAYRFFEDICTIAEVKSMAQRIEVARLLRAGVTYQEIARETGASSATISRVNRALLYGAEGYRIVLDALDGESPEESK